MDVVKKSGRAPLLSRLKRLSSSSISARVFSYSYYRRQFPVPRRKHNLRRNRRQRPNRHLRPRLQLRRKVQHRRKAQSRPKQRMLRPRSPHQPPRLKKRPEKVPAIRPSWRHLSTESWRCISRTSTSPGRRSPSWSTTSRFLPRATAMPTWPRRNRSIPTRRCSASARCPNCLPGRPSCNWSNRESSTSTPTSISIWATTSRFRRPISKPITLKNLLTHTPGFEDQVIGLFARDADTTSPLGKILARSFPARVRPPGELASYSNHGTALAGHIVAQVSGMPWEDYIEKNILEPLGMKHTSVRQPATDKLSARDVEGLQVRAGQIHRTGVRIRSGCAGRIDERVGRRHGAVS